MAKKAYEVYPDPGNNAVVVFGARWKLGVRVYPNGSCGRTFWKREFWLGQRGTVSPEARKSAIRHAKAFRAGK